MTDAEHASVRRRSAVAAARARVRRLVDAREEGPLPAHVVDDALLVATELEAQQPGEGDTRTGRQDDPSRPPPPKAPPGHPLTTRRPALARATGAGSPRPTFRQKAKRWPGAPPPPTIAGWHAVVPFRRARRPRLDPPDTPRRSLRRQGRARTSASPGMGNEVLLRKMLAAATLGGALVVNAALPGVATAAPAGGQSTLACGYYETQTVAYYSHCGTGHVKIEVDLSWTRREVYWCLPPGEHRIGPADEIDNAYAIGSC